MPEGTKLEDKEMLDPADSPERATKLGQDSPNPAWGS